MNYSKEKGGRLEDVEKTAVPTSTGKKNQPRNDFPVALVTSPKWMSVEGFQLQVVLVEAHLRNTQVN